MLLFVEKYSPWVAGIALAAALWHWGVPVRNPDQLLNAGINIGGVLVGFAMTAKSILLTLPPTRFRITLVQAGVIRGLMTYLLQAAGASLTWVVASALLLAAPEWVTKMPTLVKGVEVGSPWACRAMATWCGLGLSVFLSVFRVTYLFGQAIREDAPKAPGSKVRRPTGQSPE